MSGEGSGAPPGPATLGPGARRLAWAAPLYLLSFALLRSYLEMAHLSGGDRFSYYTGLHHLCWYASVMLALILVAHLVLEVAVARLVWLMYGISLSAIPLVWSLVSGEPLHLEYLVGSPREILAHVATFAASYRRDWPLAAEVVIIFVAMVVIGRRYTGSWLRGLHLGVVSHLTLAALGLAFFGKAPGKRAVLSIVTELPRRQPLQALGWVHMATLFTLLLLWRTGVFQRGRRSWGLAAIVALEAWIAWILAVGWSGWFETGFDIVATALPLVTVALIATRALRADRRLVPRAAWASLGLLLVLQSAVVVPIALHQEHRLLRPFKRRSAATGRAPRGGVLLREAGPPRSAGGERPLPEGAAP